MRLCKGLCPIVDAILIYDILIPVIIRWAKSEFQGFKATLLVYIELMKSTSKSILYILKIFACIFPKLYICLQTNVSNTLDSLIALSRLIILLFAFRQIATQYDLNY